MLELQLIQLMKKYLWSKRILNRDQPPSLAEVLVNDWIWTLEIPTRTHIRLQSLNAPVPDVCTCPFFTSGVSFAPGIKSRRRGNALIWLADINFWKYDWLKFLNCNQWDAFHVSQFPLTPLMIWNAITNMLVDSPTFIRYDTLTCVLRRHVAKNLCRWGCGEAFRSTIQRRAQKCRWHLPRLESSKCGSILILVLDCLSWCAPL